MSQPYRRKLKTLVGASSVISAGNDSQPGLGIARTIALAKIAEREKITGLFTADLLQADPAGLSGTTGSQDPLMALAALSQATSHIGLIATVSTSWLHPYHLARQVGTLDHLSGGRAGWNAVTSSVGEENFGDSPLPAPQERYARATEFIEVMNALYDANERETAQRTASGGIRIDPARLHPINYRGDYFQVAGPLNVPPSPQRRPVQFQAGQSDAGVTLGARYAEVIYTSQPTLVAAQAFVADVHQRAQRFGRQHNLPLIMNFMMFLIARRAGAGILTLLIVSAVVFFITSLLPGDAAQMILGQNATPETVAALRQQLGLDQPLLLRYCSWLGGMLHGDFGISFASHLPVAQLVAQRIPATFELAAITTLICVPLALMTGIAAAMNRGSLVDRLLVVSTMATVAVPEFLVATVAVLIFAVKLHWVSAMSFGSPDMNLLSYLKSYALPVLTLCCVLVAQMARMTRAAIINQLDSPYLEMARLKGVSPLRAVLRHALPNAVGPIANSISLSLSYLFGGVIIIETIFSYPGLASALVDAVSNRDLPVVQFCVMLFAACYLILLLAADILTIAFNPKWRS